MYESKYTSLLYPARFRRTERLDYVVKFADFPDVETGGPTVADAMQQAIKHLRIKLEQSMGDREPIPVPSKLRRGQKLVPVSFHIAGKLVLHLAIRERGISQSELARRLRVRETVVRRMLDPHHYTHMDKIQSALLILGKRIVMQIDDHES